MRGSWNLISFNIQYGQEHILLITFNIYYLENTAIAIITYL